MQRRVTSNSVKAGVYVVLMLLGGIAMAITVGGGLDRLKSRTEYNVRFTIEGGAKGIKPGSSVLLGGLDVGKVTAVRYLWADDAADMKVPAAILVTDSPQLAAGVREELINQTRTLSRAAIIEKSLADFGALIVVDSLEEGCALVNRLAPEHVEVITADSEATASQINNAGAIFVGPYSPESVGDYFAGTNHVLPTGGTARFSSALGVYDFLKRTSIVRYTREELLRTAHSIERLALAEGFEAHARAATIRYE